MLEPLGDCQSPPDLETFAKRHREALNQGCKNLLTDTTFLNLLINRQYPDDCRSIAKLESPALEHREQMALSLCSQLGEEAYRYANPISAPLFSFPSNVVMNLMQCGGRRPIRRRLRK